MNLKAFQIFKTEEIEYIETTVMFIVNVVDSIADFEISGFRN